MTKEEKLIIEEEREKIRKERPLVQEITEDELFEYSFKVNRNRYDHFPDRLPTKARKPYPPDEHKHIGMYESKQDLYLYIAHAYNTCIKRIQELESEVQKLKEKS